MKQSIKIKWVSKKVLVSLIDPTPKNYKIRTELGMERLQASLASFGMAGNMVCNPEKVKGVVRYKLIDGNSRREEAIRQKEKQVWISIPSRPLTPKEFVEMSAMFDFAKAGDVDMDMINSDLGSSKDFLEKYKLNVPAHLLDKMGSKAVAPGLEYPEEGGEDAKLESSDIKMVQLFFTAKQEKEFRVMQEKFYKKFKVNNVTDMVFKALKSIK